MATPNLVPKNWMPLKVIKNRWVRLQIWAIPKACLCVFFFDQFYLDSNMSPYPFCHHLCRLPLRHPGAPCFQWEEITWNRRRQQQRNNKEKRFLKHVKAPYHPYHPYRPCLAISSILLGMSQPPKNLRSPFFDLSAGSAALPALRDLCGGLFLDRCSRAGLARGFSENGVPFQWFIIFPIKMIATFMGIYDHICILVYISFISISWYIKQSHMVLRCWFRAVIEEAVV
jgi:hypothetical protein